MFTQHFRALDIEDPLLSVHAYRATLLTKLDNAGVPELDAARLTGHNIKTMSYGVYSGGAVLARLAAVVERIEYIVYIDPVAYNALPSREARLQLARVVGRINRKLPAKSFVLSGPGRWGSNDLRLGVPVRSADINHCSL